MQQATKAGMLVAKRKLACRAAAHAANLEDLAFPTINSARRCLPKQGAHSTDAHSTHASRLGFGCALLMTDEALASEPALQVASNGTTLTIGDDYESILADRLASDKDAGEWTCRQSSASAVPSDCRRNRTVIHAPLLRHLSSHTPSSRKSGQFAKQKQRSMSDCDSKNDMSCPAVADHASVSADCHASNLVSIHAQTANHIEITRPRPSL